MDDAALCRACGDEIEWPRVEDVTPMRRHCVVDSLATRRIVCIPCWRRIPARLRIAAILGYRRRRTDPARHDDAQAGILQWCRDQSAGRTAQ